ncbi:MAG TPA: hypothetical protein DCZ94_15445 [Lentisphaeria bacterium]|nr:MAG: hypothetical protein A2X48_17170 [Lentisphaerae bacterium GWF2_49_21]HBC88344.1 hypothetical protein [Lentisphaeria bacterium]
MSKTEGQNEAIRIAAAKLAGADMSRRADNLGFSFMDKGTILIRAFGADYTVDLKSFDVRNKKAGQPVRPDLKIIILHYLLFDNKFSETGKFITFRDLPGGQFYLEPYKSRSVNILSSVIKDDVARLKKNLGRLDWKDKTPGDIGAEIHVIGKIKVNLIYYKSDEEMPATADFVYDSSIKNVFSTEDVVVMASLICRMLL